MPRLMQRVIGSMAANTLTAVLTPTTGHKFEVLLVAIGPNNGLANWLQILHRDVALTSRYIDSYRLPTTETSKSFSYNGIVLLAGESLMLRSVPASGTAAVNYVVSYVDVDFT